MKDNIFFRLYVMMFLFLVWFQLFAMGCNLMRIREAVVK